jgi:hypothetical protein
MAPLDSMIQWRWQYDDLLMGCDRNSNHPQACNI